MLSKLKRISVSNTSKNEREYGYSYVGADEIDRRGSTASTKSNSSFVRVAKRLAGKSKNGDTIQKTDPTNRLGILFFSLPHEIRLQVLLNLSMKDMFSCRLSCRSFDDLIRENEVKVARYYMYTTYSRFYTMLYSQIPNQERGLFVLYQLGHMYNASQNLAMTMSKFIRTEIMRYTGGRERRAFEKDEQHIQQVIMPLLFVLYHFLTIQRHHTLQFAKQRGTPFEGFWASPAHEAMIGGEMIRVICECYDNEMLLHVHKTYNFLVKAYTRQMRAPTYMTGLEASLRNFGGQSPSRSEILSFLAVGGLDNVRKILTLPTCQERKRAFRRFVSGLSESSNIHWRENWAKLLYGPFPVPSTAIHFSALPDPTRMPFPELWDRCARAVFEKNGIQDTADNWHSIRTFISAILGYDILNRLAIPQHFQANLGGVQPRPVVLVPILGQNENGNHDDRGESSHGDTDEDDIDEGRFWD